ncbi:pentapeptide repeat-containing protein [Parasphingorhabdus sp.]|uniref:pentapeptide repeat-containing protein n=1 Tax=Parasphingorhabdus sp. TaxID=2709688 RepID=UPI003A91E946
MTRRLFLTLLWVALILTGGGSTRAEADESALSDCHFALGDIWDDRDIPQHEIDGNELGALSDFIRMLDRREPGVTIVKGGDFSGWDFRAIVLSGVCFEESNLAGANFAGVSAPGAGFIKADLTGANLAGAHMPAVMFRNAGLKHVVAAGADFSGGHFDGGWFEGSVEGWNVDGANMTGFTFVCGMTVSDGCPVYQGGEGISAKGADFTEATLHSFGLHDVDLAGARIDRTIIGPGQITYLAQADFRGPVILRGGDQDVLVSAAETQTLLVENAKQAALEKVASFDCAKGASKVEREICGEYASDLRRADRDMAALYERAKDVDPDAKPGQLAWLRQRNKCAVAEYSSDCIRDSYDRRKGALLGLLGETAWLAPGESALFIDDVLPVPAAYRQSELFARITPALVGASMTNILVERTGDGLYAIKGSAVGANAHLCSIGAASLYIDRESGWYIPVSEGPAIPIFRILDGRLEIFANGKPDYEQYPEVSDFMSCGMRAAFGETTRIHAGEALIKRYRQSLSEEM